MSLPVELRVPVNSYLICEKNVKGRTVCDDVRRHDAMKMLRLVRTSPDVVL